VPTQTSAATRHDDASPDGSAKVREGDTLETVALRRRSRCRFVDRIPEPDGPRLASQEELDST